MIGSNGWGISTGYLLVITGGGVRKLHETDFSKTPPLMDFVPAGMLT